MQTMAYVGAQVFDGFDLWTNRALIVRGGAIGAIVPEQDIPGDAGVIDLDGGTLAPGFVDVQVNGGGGVMFNDDPSVRALRTIAGAHLRLGATTILPTLITDTPAKTRAAIAATLDAIDQRVAGIAGLHLEGPHLAKTRSGAHDRTLIRTMDATDLALLVDAAQRLPVLMITLAPESVTVAQMRTLSGAGAVLSLGHSDAGLAQCRDGVAAGVRCVTHLFNAMSPLGSREPGLVGAALRLGAVSAGVIADLIHVHPDTLATALAAKQGPGRLFLVSDAMATAGSDIDHFLLNGRRIERRGGRLTLADGTLAGADLDLARAVRNIHGLGVVWADALAMATSGPASVVGCAGGRLAPGINGDFVWLDRDMTVARVWQNGRECARD